MEPELVEGDFVAVWKPTLGARLFDLNATLRLEQTEIHRTPGFRKTKRGDVLVFNFPHPNGWDKRHERTARKHGFAGTHRADVAGRVSGRCL